MLGTALKAQPLIYGLGMTDQLTRLLTAIGWSVCCVPFYFKVNCPERFLTEIRVLRKTKARQVIANVAASTGIGGLALKVLQSARAMGDPRNERAELISGFSGWADDLWNACKGLYAMIAVRDSETLNILYPATGNRFLCHKVTRGNAVIGWAVLLDTQMRDHKHFGNLRVGSIVDWLALPENASASGPSSHPGTGNSGGGPDRVESAPTPLGVQPCLKRGISSGAFKLPFRSITRTSQIT